MLHCEVSAMQPVQPEPGHVVFHSAMGGSCAAGGDDAPDGAHPPDITLEQSRHHRWAQMDPCGPVYHFILLLYDLYVVCTLFLYDFMWFLHDVDSC